MAMLGRNNFHLTLLVQQAFQKNICRWILCTNMVLMQAFGVFMKSLKTSFTYDFFSVNMVLIRNPYIVEAIQQANYDVVSHGQRWA